VDETELIFPLVPSRRLIGAAFGGFPSARRGAGSDVAGSRPYAPGDDVKLIDWAASAKLSSARGTDTFLVHEHFADESPEVLVVCDRRPSLGLYPPPLPWLDKAAALRTAARAVAASTRAARGLVGYLAAGEPGSGLHEWVSPRSRSGLRPAEDGWDAPDGYGASEESLEEVLDHLVGLRGALPPGSFVFVLSDFLAPPPVAAWLSLLERSWDVVPVVIQDPTWEASFPALPTVTVPVAGPDGGDSALVRIGAAEARRRRRANEERRAALLEDLESIGLDPVLIAAAAPQAVLRAFLNWADERHLARGGAW
jgi:uncharacterized protein (DUF58 family)